MPAKDLRIRQSVTIDKTLEEDVEDMPFEYMDPNEKQLTKRQRLLVWNAVGIFISPEARSSPPVIVVPSLTYRLR